jgi:hypothetical protein
MKGYIPSKKSSFQGIIVPPPAAPLPNSTPVIHTTSNGNELNSKTYSAFVATKNGFTAELNRINGSSIGTEKCEDDSLVVNSVDLLHLSLCLTVTI